MSRNPGSILLTPEERILVYWQKVDVQGPDDCWNWKASTVKGYGQFKNNGTMVRSHRYAWELTYGAIPNGLFVLHKCDNPKCQNPRHLFLGTNADNMEDMRKKGRSRGRR